MTKGYKKIVAEDISFFESVVGAAFCITDNEEKLRYAHDETENLVYLPEIVLIPSNVYQISQIAAYCNKNLIPITVRGGGTGLSGGALAIQGGVIISMHRFD